MRLLRNILIPVLTLVGCLFILSKWTKGFKAFTIYFYTLENAAPIATSFPDLELIDQDEHVFTIKGEKRFTLVNFVYLDCPDVCHKVNNELESIYRQMDHSVVPSKLQFVTVSFDLERDDVDKIRQYRSFFGDGIDGWTFALPYQTKEEEFYRFLKKVGIWVHRDPRSGMINHSTYLLLIDPEDKIVQVFDPARESSSAITAKLQQWVSTENPA